MAEGGANQGMYPFSIGVSVTFSGGIVDFLSVISFLGRGGGYVGDSGGYQLGSS